MGKSRNRLSIDSERFSALEENVNLIEKYPPLDWYQYISLGNKLKDWVVDLFVDPEIQIGNIDWMALFTLRTRNHGNTWNAAISLYYNAHCYSFSQTSWNILEIISFGLYSATEHKCPKVQFQGSWVPFYFRTVKDTSLKFGTLIITPMLECLWILCPSDFPEVPLYCFTVSYLQMVKIPFKLNPTVIGPNWHPDMSWYKESILMNSKNQQYWKGNPNY